MGAYFKDSLGDHANKKLLKRFQHLLVNYEQKIKLIIFKKLSTAVHVFRATFFEKTNVTSARASAITSTNARAMTSTNALPLHLHYLLVSQSVMRSACPHSPNLQPRQRLAILRKP